MKKIYLPFKYMFSALCLLFTVKHVNAQLTYDKLFPGTNLYGGNLVQTLCELSSKKVAVFGIYIDGINQDNLSLFVLDSLGNQVSSNFFENSLGGFDPNYLMASPSADGGTILGSTSGVTSPAPPENIIVKFDSSGGVQWSTLLSAGCDPFFASIKQLGNGNFVTVSNISNIGIGTCYPVEGFIISLISPSGALLSSSYFYNDTMPCMAKDIIETPDGSIFVSGGVTLMKFNNMLQPLWAKGYTNVFPGNLALDYFHLKHNLLYLDGYLYMGFSFDDYSVPGNIDNALMKADTSGQVLWSYQYNHAQNESLNEMLAGDDGRIILLSSLGNPSGIALAQVDSSGYVLDDGMVTSSTDHFFYNIGVNSHLDDGYFIAGSVHMQGSGGYDDFFVYKTDSLLTLCNKQPFVYNTLTMNLASTGFVLNTLPGFTQDTITLTTGPIVMTSLDFCSVTSTGHLNQDVKPNIFPNPSNDNFIYIDFGNTFNDAVQLNIYDSSGRLIISENISPGNAKEKIDISFLKNGLYYAAMRSDTRLMHQVFAVMH